VIASAEILAAYSCGAVADFHRLPVHSSLLNCERSQASIARWLKISTALSIFRGMENLAIPLVLVATCAFAASDEDAIQNTFVKPWMEALRSKDRARVEQLLHPAVRACITPQNKEFFDSAFAHQAESDLSGPYRVTKISPLRQPPPTFLPEDVKYPVQPTYEVDIDVKPGNVYVQFLAPSNGSWFDVIPCPSEKSLAHIRELQKQGEEQKNRAAQLVAELKDPLRGELEDLLLQQRKIDAIKKYQTAASVDLTTATLVINALQKSDR
jgi:hypothetical protein